MEPGTIIIIAILYLVVGVLYAFHKQDNIVDIPVLSFVLRTLFWLPILITQLIGDLWVLVFFID